MPRGLCAECTPQLLLVQNDDDGRRNGIVLPVSHLPFSRERGTGSVLEDGPFVLALSSGYPPMASSKFCRETSLSFMSYIHVLFAARIEYTCFLQ